MAMQPDPSPASAEAGSAPLPPSSPASGRGSSTLDNAAKWTVGALLGLAIMTLCFGLGYGTRLATEGSGAGFPAAAVNGKSAPNFGALNEIYSDIMSRYIGAKTLDPQALQQGSIDGLFKAIGDPHMGYLSQSEFLAESDGTQGSFSGIGATVQQKNGQLILTPLPDTPAMHAGVKPDDVLLSVNGASASGWSDMQAVQKIRGPRGTSVKIGVKHSAGDQAEFSITRDTINIASVHSQDLHDAKGNPVTDVGYVRIDQFTERTPQEMQKYLDGIQNKNYKGLIIDLRNDPGGVVSSVLQVAGDFVNKDPVLIVQSKNGSEQTIRPPNDGIVTKIPLAVLVNHNSASASEILAGSLRDDHRAKLIGENTFGKGTENIFVPLKSDPGGISITVARWLTPDHTSIEGTGLKPDIAVSAANNEDPNATFNAVLYRAIDYLHTGN